MYITDGYRYGVCLAGVSADTSQPKDELQRKNMMRLPQLNMYMHTTAALQNQTTSFLAPSLFHAYVHVHNCGTMSIVNISFVSSCQPCLGCSYITSQLLFTEMNYTVKVKITMQIVCDTVVSLSNYVLCRNHSFLTFKEYDDKTIVLRSFLVKYHSLNSG